MGYTLAIGKPEIEIRDWYAAVSVKREEHQEAPAYGEPTDYQNSRWPSYSTWRAFCEFVGLHEMFYDKEEGLMREVPSAALLVSNHKKQIDKAYQNFKKKYPNAVAGYSPKINFKEGVFDDPDWPEENAYLVRLEWLKYWVDWALDNCENPVFESM